MSRTANISSNSEESVTTTIDQLQSYEANFRKIPFEATLKQDLLRLGIAFDESSLTGDFKTKDYFIFTFDHIPLNEQSDGIRFKVPEEIKISSGPFSLLPTVVSVRVDPASPYFVSSGDSGAVLYLKQGNAEPIYLADVEFPPIPDWYSHTLENGKKPGEIAPVIEWGYLIYITVFRNCQYFGKDEECAFCDINHNWRQQKLAGRPYTGIKSIDEIIEVMSWIDKEDQTAKVYTITGGSVLTDLKKKGETDFYFQYAEAIEKHFPGRWMGKMVTQAWEKEDLKRFKDVGIQVYHPNYEVWDERLFKLICPGKERFIGRENWIRRIIESVDIFGPSHVIPNFVGGVELSKPWGFETVDEAVQSTSDGLDFFMSHGVVPRFTTWCPEPYTTLSSLEQQQKPPLEYFLKLLTSWKEIFEKHKLPVPPGYGEPGRGKAVFSVSAFMDVIGYEGR